MNKTIRVLVVVGVMMFAGALGIKAEGQGRGLDRGPLDKVTFIHYRRGSAKPEGVGGGGKTQCYGFLAKGARWKNTEPWTVNSSGSGMDGGTVFNVLGNSAETWDSQVSFDIFGGVTLNDSAVYQDGVADGQNVVAFGNYADGQVIAVTTVWGYFYGPANARELVEWDMLFNTDYQWAIDGDPLKMDLQNIATHELGHSAGLADLYQSQCNLETMYGYGIEGETIKQTLNAGDILGIQELYK